MNQRIRELALQAGLEMCSCGCDMPTRQSAKFAELIIQECCETVERRYKYSNGTPVSFWEMSQDLLKQHFGVDE